MAVLIYIYILGFKFLVFCSMRFHDSYSPPIVYSNSFFFSESDETGNGKFLF